MKIDVTGAIFPKKRGKLCCGKPGLKVFIYHSSLLYFREDEAGNFVVEEIKASDIYEKEDLRTSFAMWFLSLPSKKDKTIIWKQKDYTT